MITSVFVVILAIAALVATFVGGYLLGLRDVYWFVHGIDDKEDK